MAHHHQPVEEAKPFKLTGNYVKSFGGMILLGLVLLFGGWGLSKIGGGDHGGHGHETEHHEEGEEAVDHSEDHSNAGSVFKFTNNQDGEHGHGHGEEAHGEENSHGGGHASHGNEGHGEGHGGGHHEAPDHLENGTWRRAYVHPSQVAMVVDGKEVHNGVHHEVTDASKWGASLLGGTFWWMCVALFGVFFIAVGYVAEAGWYVAIKRVIEPFYRFLPIGGLLLVLIFFIFGEYLWDWRFYALNEFDENGKKVLFDTLIDGKRPFLSIVFVFATSVFLIGLWTLFGHMFRTLSLKEEQSGGYSFHHKSRTFSAMFLPIFGLGFSLTCFLWLMSMEPHWFSTIYAVYCFAGLFTSGAMITALIAMHLKEKGFLPILSGDHVHDLGKFIFAFSVFWAYIWVSQFLLIWYANIPEETIYFYNRQQDFSFLFGANVAINFFFPFLALMTRESKRKHLSLRAVIRVLLVGRFLDMFLLVIPGALGAEYGFSDVVMMAGSFVMLGGVFLLIVFKGFEQTSLVAKNHPFYEESVHHSTGV